MEDRQIFCGLLRISELYYGVLVCQKSTMAALCIQGLKILQIPRKIRLNSINIEILTETIKSQYTQPIVDLMYLWTFPKKRSVWIYTQHKLQKQSLSTKFSRDCCVIRELVSGYWFTMGLRVYWWSYLNSNTFSRDISVSFIRW